MAPGLPCTMAWMSDEPARKFGPYQVIAPVGEGGMGQVFKARDTRLDRIVALKISHARSPRHRRSEPSAHRDFVRRRSGLSGDGVRRGRDAARAPAFGSRVAVRRTDSWTRWMQPTAKALCIAI